MKSYLVMLSCVCVFLSPVIVSAQEPAQNPPAASSKPPGEEEMLRKRIKELELENLEHEEDIHKLKRVTQALVDLERERQDEKRKDKYKIELPSFIFVMIPVLTSSVAWGVSAANNDGAIGRSVAIGALAGVTSGTLLGAGVAMEDWGVIVGGSVAAIASTVMPFAFSF